MQRKFKRDFGELKNIVKMTELVFQEMNLPAGLRNVVDLATEELFVNMVTYNTESKEDILIEMVPHALGLEVRLTDTTWSVSTRQAPPALILTRHWKSEHQGGWAFTW